MSRSETIESVLKTYDGQWVMVSFYTKGKDSICYLAISDIKRNIKEFIPLIGVGDNSLDREPEGKG